MQKLWEVHCKGKTIDELKKAVEDAYKELGGFTGTTTNVSFVKNMEALDRESLSEIDREHYDNSDAKEEYTTEDLAAKHVHVQQIGLDDSAEKDSEGLPWDARIHASSKSKLANGTWRIKRGVDDVAANKVKAEYRSALQQSHNTFPERTHDVVSHMVHAPVVPPQPVYQAPALVQPTIQQVMSPAVPTQPLVPQPVYQAPVQPPQQPILNTPPPMPGMSSGHTVKTFVENFPFIIANLITEGKVGQDYVNAINAHCKVDQIWKINDEQKTELFGIFVQSNIIQQAR